MCSARCWATIAFRQMPSWDGTELDGRCILWLPDSGRIVDPTVVQFQEVARMRPLGPVVGSVAAIVGQGQDVTTITAGKTLPSGTQFPLRRRSSTLLYTTASEAADHVVTGNPWMLQRLPGHQRAGRNLAAWALEALRRPAVIGRARTVPHPRVIALLDAVGDAPCEIDGAGDCYFLLRGGGQDRRLMIDQIPLPPGILPASEQR